MSSSYCSSWHGRSGACTCIRRANRGRAELDHGGQHLELVVAAGHAGKQDVVAELVDLMDGLPGPARLIVQAAGRLSMPTASVSGAAVWASARLTRPGQKASCMPISLQARLIGAAVGRPLAEQLALVSLEERRAG